MAPQPLRSFNAKGIKYGTDVPEQFPHLAVLVAKTIATWSQIEVQLGKTITIMLGADAHAALAMYSAIQNERAQLAALRAAAKSVLSEQEMLVFEAVMKFKASQEQDRHRFAHWIWASAAGAENALVFVNPNLSLEVDKVVAYSMKEALAPVDRNLSKYLDALMQEPLVYTQAELEDTVKRAEKCRLIISMLHDLVGAEGEVRENKYKMLVSEPQIAQLLAHLNGRNNRSP